MITTTINLTIINQSREYWLRHSLEACPAQQLPRDYQRLYAAERAYREKWYGVPVDEPQWRWKDE